MSIPLHKTNGCNMKFKIGQKWINRNGDIVTIVTTDGFGLMYAKRADGRSYTLYEANGCYFRDGSGQDSGDLIVEYDSPTPVLKFEVGQIWRTRGKLKYVLVTHVRETCIDGVYCDEFGNRTSRVLCRRYTDGKFSRDTENLRDLVELWLGIDNHTAAQTSDPIIDDCECRMKKHGFTGHMQYCPDYRTFSQMQKEYEVKIASMPHYDYKTKSDMKESPIDEDAGFYRTDAANSMQYARRSRE